MYLTPTPLSLSVGVNLWPPWRQFQTLTQFCLNSCALCLIVYFFCMMPSGPTTLWTLNGTCLVWACLSVCSHSSANITHFYTQNEVRRGLYLLLICGFSINLSIQKLWREVLLACFEYHACISSNIKGKHCVSESVLACLTHRGWCSGANHLPGRAMARRYCSEPPLAFLWTEASNAA